MVQMKSIKISLCRDKIFASLRLESINWVCEICAQFFSSRFGRFWHNSFIIDFKVDRQQGPRKKIFFRFESERII